MAAARRGCERSKTHKVRGRLIVGVLETSGVLMFSVLLLFFSKNVVIISGGLRCKGI